MKVLSTHSKHRSVSNRPWHLSVFVLTCAFLMIFSGSLFAGNTTFTHLTGNPSPKGVTHVPGKPSSPNHIPGKPASKGFANVPGKPSPIVLSHVPGKPDLTISNITFETKEKDTAWVIIKVKNIGKVTSSKTTVSALLTRGNRTRDKKSFGVKALKAGHATEVKWFIHTTPGKNVVKAAVNDSNNRQNNTLEKSCLIMARVPGVLAHREEIKAKGARTGLSKKAGKRGILTIKEVTFDDHRGKKPDETWVSIEIKNRGKAVTPATSIPVELQRADGSRRRKIFRVRALKPGETDRIEGFFRMTRGYNTLRIKGIGGVSFHNISTFTSKGQFFSKTHYFNPPKIKFNAGQATLAKNAARVSKAKPSGEMTPNSNVLENLSKDKPIHIHKPVKIATYDAQVGTFTHPQRNEIIPPNKPYTIAWTMPDPGPDARLWLFLKCTQGDPNMPDLTLARDMAPSIRNYTWDVGNLPTGRYHLELRIIKGGNSQPFTISFFIDHVHLHVTQETVSPKPRYIGKPVTVRGLITNSGSDALDPMEIRVTIHGPGGFYAENQVKADTMLHGGPGFPCGITFTPPFYGIYRAVFEPDANHHYPLATQDLSKSEKTFFFGVDPLPDLLATINKVGDHASAGTSHFHIRVKNIGSADAPETTAEFYIIDPRNATYVDSLHDVDKTYHIPRLGPGETWTHSYTHRWYGITGRAIYGIEVDPGHHIRELRESNNRVDDVLNIYLAGLAHSTTTSHKPVAQLAVAYVTGLDHIVAGQNFAFTVRFQNQTSNRSILPASSVEIHSRFVLSSGKDTFDIPELYPGETYDLVLDGKTDHVGSTLFAVMTQKYTQDHFLPDIDQFAYKTTIIVAENTEIPRGVIETLAGNKPLPPAGKPITILSPDKNKIWTVGKTYQIAWTGQVAGPFTVTLIPKDHPDAPIQIADNTTQRSLDYAVGSNLTPGAYRVKVQGTDGRGVSNLFSITADTKPNLKFKATSISNELSGNDNKPYRIKVQAIIENTGGQEKQPFFLAYTVVQNGQVVMDTVRPIPAMLDQQTIFRQWTTDLQGTPADITITVDPGNALDESNERDNNFRNPHYSMTPYPDLRLACLQEAHRLHCMIKNIGNAAAPATTLQLQYSQSGVQWTPKSSSWQRQGNHMVCTPLPIPRISAGRMAEIDSPALPSPIPVGSTYLATVNPEKNIKESVYTNNMATGILSAHDTAKAADKGWKKAFGVKDSTPSRSFYVVDNEIAPAQARPRFIFQLWNKSTSSSLITPKVAALLVLGQKTREQTFHYNIPRLFPGNTGNRDSYTINRPTVFPAAGGDISYHLWLKKGNNMVLLTSGTVELKEKLPCH